MDLETVRQSVQEALRTAGLEAVSKGERILLQDGQLVGRRFEFEGVSAVWMCDSPQIKFFDRAGKLFLTIDVPSTRGGRLSRAA